MATEFRPLNETELHALDRAVEKGEANSLFPYSSDDLQVSYERLSGGFCVCVILERRIVTARVKGMTGKGTASLVLFRGASRQSMHDKPNRIKGDMLAFNRAIRDSKPVTL